MRARRLTAGVLVALGALAVVAVPAVAAPQYGDVCSFVGTPAFCTAGEFSTPIGVAVDNSSSPPTKGEVYVADFGNGRVVRFDSAGKELSVIGGFVNPVWDAVDPSTGDLYVSDFSAGTVSKFNPAGEPVADFGTAGQITGLANPAGVAVNPVDGHLFVAQRGAPVITEYDSSGKELGSFSAPVEAAADGIAVDSEGNVYAVDEKIKVVEYPVAKRSEPVVFDTHEPFSVAVDPSTSPNHVYVEQNTGAGAEVAMYDTVGTLLSSFGVGDFSSAGSAGLAVNSATHEVYASDIENNRGLIFEEGEAPEAPATEAAGEGETRGTSAVLHGTLNPAGATGPGEYQFQYNTGGSCTGGGSVPVSPAKVAEAKQLPVEAQATGLFPRTEYKFCLLASNPFGATTGPELTLTTGPGKPVIEEQSSPEQTGSGAKLTALINPSGAGTTCDVKYGLDSSYGSQAPCPEALGEGLTGQPANITLTGLQPHQTYHYKFTANNETGESEGIDQTLKTQMIAPTISETLTAPVVGRANVLLSGMVNPENTLVFSHFVYGPTAQYGSATPVTEGGSGLGAETVSQVLEGLKPGTTYHYALVASNPAGNGTSVDRTFRTGPATPPVAATGAAGNITTTSAEVAGSVNPDALTTTYTIQIGVDTTYGGELTGVAGSGSETVPVTATFNNLQPGTLYHYRVVAINEDATSYGEDRTFTTTGVPNPLSAPPAAQLLSVPPVPFPAEPTTTKTVIRPQTKAQKLAAALKACTKKPKSKRASCVRQTRRNYGAAKKKVHKG